MVPGLSLGRSLPLLLDLLLLFLLHNNKYLYVAPANLIAAAVPAPAAVLIWAIYILFAGREVRIGINCARGLEYGPRPQAEDCTQD